jgi:hypothetical protein
MKILVLPMLLLFAVQSASTLRTVPSSLVGQWKIGKPFYDMTPQPIGLSAEQEKKLIGKRLDVESTSVSACGTRIQITSVESTAYSAEGFLEKYRIRPDQIDLVAPLTNYSFSSRGLTAICGSPEAFDIISDGRNAVLENANDYFHLSKLAVAR